MASTFGKWVKVLKKTSTQFDESANQRKLELLGQLSKEKLKSTKSLLEYFEVLLYTIAYPPNKKVYTFSSKELSRISKHFKKSRGKEPSVFINSGLPFTNYESCFSFDLVEWLINHPACNVEWSNFEESIPALLAFILIPLTYSITQGIIWGFLSYTIIKLLLGKFKDISITLLIIDAVAIFSLVIDLIK